MRPAERLRAAATRLRDLDQAATPGPWCADDNRDTWSLHSGPKQIIKAPKEGTPYAEYWPSEADSDLIVTMRQVPNALANWLNAEADSLTCIEEHPGCDGTELVTPPALAVADAILNTPETK